MWYVLRIGIALAGAIVGGTIAAVCYDWLVIGPKMTRMHRAGKAMAAALDMVKEKHPSVWDDVKFHIENAVKPTSEIENVIRGFRNLMPRL